MFYPKIIYYEKGIENYKLGKELLEKYKDVPKIEIQNHNNIEELRKKQNSEFTKLKQYLIIGTRKTHKYVENHMDAQQCVCIVIWYVIITSVRI